MTAIFSSPGSINTSATATATAESSAAGWVRTVLRANAIVTSLSGLLLVAAAGTFADILDIDTWAVRAVGASLLPFALAVGVTSTVAAARLRPLVLGIAVADVLWVVATVVLVAFGAFSAGGSAFALLVAVMVGGFAAAELRGAAALR